MKVLLALLAITTAASVSFANKSDETPSLICVADNKLKVSVSGDIESSEAYMCEGFVAPDQAKDICFTGDSKASLGILRDLAKDGIMGDEWSMKRSRAHLKTLKYDIFDETEGEVIGEVVINRCATSNSDTVTASQRKKITDEALELLKENKFGVEPKLSTEITKLNVSDIMGGRVDVNVDAVEFERNEIRCRFVYDLKSNSRVGEGTCI